MSTWMCPNLREGWGNFPIPDSVCRIILDFWHGMQDVAHFLTSAAMESQIYLDLIILIVVFLEGWDRPCSKSNTFFRRLGGTQGRGDFSLTSHNIEGPWGVLIGRRMTLEVGGRVGGGNRRCWSARSCKSRPSCVNAMQFLDRASATGFDLPAM